MATFVSPSIAWNNNGDSVQFRLWGKALSDFLIQMGAVKQSYVGEINWDTVTKPGVSGFGGYEVFQINDGVGTYFLKVGYGTYNGSALWLMTRYWMGTTHDGAGNLGPTQRQIGDCNYTGAIVTTLKGCIANGTFSLWTPQHVMVIDRRRNQVTGAPIAVDDFSTFSINVNAALNPASSLSFKTIPLIVWGGTADAFCVVPWGLTVSQRGVGNVSLYKWRSVFPNSHVSTGGCTFHASEIVAETTFQVPLIGTAQRTYLATNVTGSANSSANYIAAMVWE